MKLKQITKLLFAFLFVFALSSCNSDSTEFTSTSPSADAQIYSLKLSAKPYTKQDTLNYPVLAKTRFAIDQFRQLIYNPDSLPYKTELKKFAASIGFALGTPSSVQLIYPNDSVVTWNRTDSIDFSTPLYPKFRVTAANGTNSKEYTIDIRVHKIDPDTIVWQNVPTLQQPSTIGTRQKTLLNGNTFYTFSIDSDKKLYLYKATKSGSYEPRKAITGLDASNIILESITIFNGYFFGIDTAQKGYSSPLSDGLVWSAKNNNVYNIVGILPTLNPTEDSLLVTTKVGGKYYLAKTVDMQTLKIQNEISDNFPAIGFSSVTNYDRTNTNKNILAITGGKDFTNKESNLTWSIQVTDNNILRFIPNQSHSIFKAKSGIASFLYDGYLYALTGNKLYKTSSYGYKWTNVPSKEVLDSRIPKASNQSVIVDSDNYIWIFGGIPDSGTTPIVQVWKGRLNKLNTK